MPKSARYHIDRANSIVFTSKRLPLQPVSSERNHQVALYHHGPQVSSERNHQGPQVSSERNHRMALSNVYIYIYTL